MGLELIPITLKEANYFVQQWHRHHKGVTGHKFSIGVALDNRVCGVAIVGRPVSRVEDNGWTLEVTRVCTDGTKNACSKLYAAAWRVTRNLGYRRLITYILQEENGNTLRASGWKNLGLAGGGSWNCKGRPRVDTHPLQMKMKFCIGN